MSSRTEYSRRLGFTDGIDPEGTDGRLTYAENIWRDYAVPGDATWRTVPGYRQFAALAGAIHGIWKWGRGKLNDLETESETDLYIVHTGTALRLVRGDDGAFLSFYGLTLAERESSGTLFSGRFYLLDGDGFYECRVEAGSGGTLSLSWRAVGGYEPTVRIDGEEFEPANLLGSRYTERCLMSGSESPSNGDCIYAPGRNTDEATLISGASAEGEIVLPDTVVLFGRTVPVTSIGKNAFSGNTALTSVTLPDSVTSVGTSAFRGCTALTSFRSGEGLSVIGLNAFQGCTALETVVLPGTLTTVRSFAFGGCTVLDTLKYGGEDFTRDVSVSPLGNGPLTALTPQNGTGEEDEPRGMFRYVLHDPAASVYRVKVGGTVVLQTGDPYYTVETEGGLAVSVTLRSADRRALVGKQLDVTVNARSGHLPGEGSIGEGFSDYSGTYPDLIRRCRLIAAWDGRLFVSGNPDLPDAVFFCGRTADGAVSPDYFGIYHYFRDGEEVGRITSLVPAPDALYVFCGSDGGGSVFRHIAETNDSTLLPRVYPRDGGYRSVGNPGEAILYRDNPVWLTANGVFCMTGEDLRFERSAVCRSLEAASLFPKDADDGKLAVFSGYLTVFFPDGTVLLGDGRQIRRQGSGENGYEWWRLSGIGGHKDDAPLYRYSSSLPEGAGVYGITLPPEELFDQPVSGTVTSEGGFLSVGSEPNRYSVYGGEERVGGTLRPATAIFSDGENLVFGTADGKLYRVNTDCRGLPPTSERVGMTDANLAAYAASHPGELAPEYYHFDRHAIPVRIETQNDDGGVSTYRKNTVSGSGHLDLDFLPRSFFSLTVTSDGKGEGSRFDLIASGADFSTLDFAHLSFSGIRPGVLGVREKSRRWYRKRYTVTSSSVGAPLSLRGFGYLFEIAGKVKND